MCSIITGAKDFLLVSYADLRMHSVKMLICSVCRFQRSMDMSLLVIRSFQTNIGVHTFAVSAFKRSFSVRTLYWSRISYEMRACEWDPYLDALYS